MNNYEKIKNMTIEEMAEFIIFAYFDTYRNIQNKLCKCLPLPTEEEIKNLIQEEIKILQAESEE